MMSREQIRHALAFACVLVKLKQGAATEGSAITLDQQECKDLITGLQILKQGGDSGSTGD